MRTTSRSCRTCLLRSVCYLASVTCENLADLPRSSRRGRRSLQQRDPLARRASIRQHTTAAVKSISSCLFVSQTNSALRVLQGVCSQPPETTADGPEAQPGLPRPVSGAQQPQLQRQQQGRQQGKQQPEQAVDAVGAGPLGALAGTAARVLNGDDDC